MEIDYPCNKKQCQWISIRLLWSQYHRAAQRKETLSCLFYILLFDFVYLAFLQNLFSNPENGFLMRLKLLDKIKKLMMLQICHTFS
jgi:hypothetical protein